MMSLIFIHLALVAALQIFPKSHAFPCSCLQQLPCNALNYSSQIFSTKYPFSTSAESVNDKKKEYSTEKNENNLIELDEDRRTIALHFFSCLTTAYSLVKYENYECSNLKPQQAALKKSSVIRTLEFPQIFFDKESV